MSDGESDSGSDKFTAPRRSSRVRVPVVEQNFNFGEPAPRRKVAAPARRSSRIQNMDDMDDDEDNSDVTSEDYFTDEEDEGKPKRASVVARVPKVSSARVKPRLSYNETQHDHTDSEDIEEHVDIAATRLPAFSIDKILDFCECGENVEPDYGTGYCNEYTFIDTKEKFECDEEMGAADRWNVINSDDRAGEVVVKYLIKWCESSYLHNTWNTQEELEDWQVGGLRKLSTYINRLPREEELTGEELESLNIEREIARAAIEQGKIAERIVDSEVIETPGHIAFKKHCLLRRGGGDGPDGDVEIEEDPIATELGTKIVLVLWSGLSYEDCTWEHVDVAQNAPVGTPKLMQEYERRGEKYFEQDNSLIQYYPLTTSTFAVTDDEKMTDIQGFLAGKTLRPYQLEGINWMFFNYCQGRNGILADEMGLGKTVQCATFIDHLYNNCTVAGPYLIVVPLSTIQNWYRELRKWAPNMDVILYIGSQKSRAMIQQHEFYGETPPNVNRRWNKQRPIKFNILLTTYEFINKDTAVLKQFNWRYLIVDEAHRLKDHESKLYESLQTLNTEARLLVTGTPLQNNVRELWCLLHFLHPNAFGTINNFELQYGGINNQTQVTELHRLLQPYILRRIKKNVLKHMPGKVERMIVVDLTLAQKRLYRYILTQNSKELVKGSKTKVNLTNIIMELKKCCNHPNLFKDVGVETPQEEQLGVRIQEERMQWTIHPPEGSHLPTIVTPEENRYAVAALVRTSAKLALLDRMLVKLYQTGNRVLIFSQMVRLLDILSIYCELRGFMTLRLDGTMRAQDRQKSMDKYNEKDSKYFTFLLSTRAGGLGVNLATADTVIIYDSDWNPQNDLQAEARAHRLGQQNTVCIYRLVCSQTVEERILEKAKNKMILDHLIIQRMENKKDQNMFDNKELDKILKFGTAALFGSGDTAMPDMSNGDMILPSLENQGHVSNINDEQLESLLVRPSVDEIKSEEGENENETDAFLSTFKVSDFANNGDKAERAAAAAAAKPVVEDEEDEVDWDKLLEFAPGEDEQDLVEGPRQRSTVNYKQVHPGDQALFSKLGIKSRDVARLVRALCVCGGEQDAWNYLEQSNSISKFTTDTVDWRQFLHKIADFCVDEAKNHVEDKEVATIIAREKVSRVWETIEIQISDVLFMFKQVEVVYNLIEREIIKHDQSFNKSALTTKLSTVLVDGKTSLLQVINNGVDTKDYTTIELDCVKNPDLFQYCSTSGLNGNSVFPLHSWRANTGVSVHKTFKDACGWTVKDDLMLVAGAYLYGTYNIHKILQDPRLGLGEKLIRKKVKSEDAEEPPAEIESNPSLVDEDGFIKGIKADEEQLLKSSILANRIGTILRGLYLEAHKAQVKQEEEIRKKAEKEEAARKKRQATADGKKLQKAKDDAVKQGLNPDEVTLESLAKKAPAARKRKTDSEDPAVKKVKTEEVKATAVKLEKKPTTTVKVEKKPAVKKEDKPAEQKMLVYNNESYPYDAALLDQCDAALQAKDDKMKLYFQTLLSITNSAGGWSQAANQALSVPTILKLGGYIGEILSTTDASKLGVTGAHLWYCVSKWTNQSEKTMKTVYDKLPK